MTGSLKVLTVEVTQRCPNRCLHCSSLASPNSEVQLTANEIIEVGSQARKLGLKRICLSGGEPLLHPDIETIVSELSCLGLDVVLYTTGIHFLKNELISENWTAYQGIVSSLIFGIQSTEAAVHDAFCGRDGAFHLTRRSLIEAKKKGFPVEVHTVPNHLNMSRIEQTLDEIAQWGVEQVSFLRLVSQGYARDNSEILTLDAADELHLRNIAERCSDGHWDGMRVRFGIPFADMTCQQQVCNAGDGKLIIRYDGKVLPCEAFKGAPNPKFQIGDIREDSLSVLLSRAQELSCLHILKRQTNKHAPCPAQLIY